MYGRRLPYLFVLLSDIMPMIGCITSPDNGPATQTRLNRLLDIPSDSKNGVQYVISVPQAKVRPIMLAVNSIILIDSFEPLMRGCPTHDAVCTAMDRVLSVVNVMRW